MSERAGGGRERKMNRGSSSAASVCVDHFVSDTHTYACGHRHRMV